MAHPESRLTGAPALSHRARVNSWTVSAETKLLLISLAVPSSQVPKTSTHAASTRSFSLSFTSKSPSLFPFSLFCHSRSTFPRAGRVLLQRLLKKRAPLLYPRGARGRSLSCRADLASCFGGRGSVSGPKVHLYSEVKELIRTSYFPWLVVCLKGEGNFSPKIHLLVYKTAP